MLLVWTFLKWGGGGAYVKTDYFYTDRVEIDSYAHNYARW